MRNSPAGLFIGVLLAVTAAAAAHGAGLDSPAIWTAAVTALCATWWVLEPVPIPVTSLVPFAAFPLLGVMDHKEVAGAYGHTLILLLLGGFMLSTAMESSGAHRRLALGMARLVGGSTGRASPRRMVLGFMLAAAVSSMWISNTATTLILLPVALATLEPVKNEKVGTALLLGIGWAASIGGLGTPIGTPPNVIFMAAFEDLTGQTWSFVDWMKIGLPVVMLLLPAAFWVLSRDLPSERIPGIERLGPWTRRERRVLFVFALTALAWITRTAPSGGWQAMLGGATPGDASVALGALVVMFLTPDGTGGRLLDWPTAEKIPWGLLLLFGGGLAIAHAFKVSGLSEVLGGHLGELTRVPTVVMIVLLCLAVTFLTEVTSNTATAALLMPLLGAAALGAGLGPAELMVPATLSASCAFMLPVATAPNAIVYGTGRIPSPFMAARGLQLNLVGVVVIGLVSWALL